MSDFNPSGDRDEQATEHAAIQVDAYGVKARVQPADVEEAAPRTWNEVGKAVNDRLKSITVGLLDLVKEAVYGSVRVIKGLTSLPGAAAKRIEGAHQKADQAEGIKQHELEAEQAPVLAAKDATEALEQILLALQARGHHVALNQVGQETWIVTAVRPEHAELVQELATNELKQLESDADDAKNTPNIPFIELKGDDVTAWVGSEKKSPRQLESQADADDRKDTPDASLDLAED